MRRDVAHPLVEQRRSSGARRRVGTLPGPARTAAGDRTEATARRLPAAFGR